MVTVGNTTVGEQTQGTRHGTRALTSVSVHTPYTLSCVLVFKQITWPYCCHSQSNVIRQVIEINHHNHHNCLSIYEVSVVPSVDSDQWQYVRQLPNGVSTQKLVIKHFINKSEQSTLAGEVKHVSVQSTPLIRWPHIIRSWHGSRASHVQCSHWWWQAAGSWYSATGVCDQSELDFIL